jgi:hypothetical protein
MATTTNYGWTTPDDTALVKDGAAAIRTLGTSVDTTTKNLNPSTTLGDIEYRSSTANTNTRLGIGSTGQVLTVAGGVPSWAAPAGGSGANWSLLNSGGTALTGAQTITISGISAKDKVMVLVTGASSANATSEMSFYVNGDNSSGNYVNLGSRIVGYSPYDSSNNAISNVTSGNDIIFGRMANSASFSVSGGMTMTGCNSSGVKQFISCGGANSDGTSNFNTNFSTQGIWNDSATITSVTVRSSTGNFDAGTIFVYTSAS